MTHARTHIANGRIVKVDLNHDLVLLDSFGYVRGSSALCYSIFIGHAAGKHEMCKFSFRLVIFEKFCPIVVYNWSCLEWLTLEK